MCLILSFFEFIRIYFGIEIYFLLKDFIKLIRHNINFTILYFLKTCLKEKLIPQHLYGIMRFNSNNQRSSLNKINRMKILFLKLRLELQDVIRLQDIN